MNPAEIICQSFKFVKLHIEFIELTGGDKLLTKENGATDTGGDAETGGQRVWDNEEDEVAYNWSLFHLMFALATLYAMMTLTNWFE